MTNILKLFFVSIYIGSGGWGKAGSHVVMLASNGLCSQIWVWTLFSSCLWPPSTRIIAMYQHAYPSKEIRWSVEIVQSVNCLLNQYENP